MIFKSIVIFLLLLTSMYIGTYLQQDSGYILIAYNHWTIETTLFVMLAALFSSVLLLYFSAAVFNKIINISSLWKNWRLSRQIRKSQAKTKRGLIEFNEGHWKRAEKYLIDALPNADIPLLNYLTAARAAQEVGNNKLRDDYLREAEQSMPEAKIAIELTMAQLQIDNHQWEQALRTLKHLQTLSPKHPYVLKLLMRLYEENKNWAQLILLLPEIKKMKIMSDQDFIKKQCHIYLQELLNLINQNQTKNIETFIPNIPKDLMLDANITYVYAKYLIDINENKRAENRLRLFLKKQINEQILELYSHIDPQYFQLQFIESLLKTNNNSAALNLCLGKISAAKQLWGKAEVYFEKSIKISPSSKAYEELGMLFEMQNENKLAFNAYKNGLKLFNGEDVLGLL